MALQETFLFTPTSIRNCVMWFDAAEASTVIRSGTNVTQWNDRTGNGNTAVAGTATYPVYKPNTLNGLPTISLQGANDYFLVSNNLTTTTYPSLCYFIVVNPSSSQPNTSYAGILSTDSPTQYGRTLGLGAGAWQEEFYNGFNNISLYTANTWALVSLQFVGTSSATLAVNGTTYAGTASATGNNTTGFKIGSYNSDGSYATFNANFDVGEILVYGASLTTTERQQIEGYLAWKWGLQTSLPSNHPFRHYRTLANPPVPSVGVPVMPIRTQGTLVFNPRSVTGINAWYDGADPLGTGVQPTFNTTLTTWFDKSGNGRNASGGTPATFVNGGVSFNGTTNYYTVNIPYSSNYSIFLVATNTSVAQCYFFARNSIGGSRYPTFIQGYIGAGIGLEWYETADRGTIATTPSSPFMASVDHTQGTSIQGYYFGTQSFSIAQTQAYNAAAWDTLGQAGATVNVGFYGGIMKELIFYSNTVTTSQRQQLEGYLAWKWGLTGSLPPGHPYKTAPIAPFPYRTIPFNGSLNQWLPTRVAGIALWLDGADPTSITLNGTNVSQWSDKSGNGRHATQSSPTNQPAYVRQTNTIQLFSPTYFNMTSMPSEPYDILVVATALSSNSNWRTLFRTSTVDPGMNPVVLSAGNNNLGYWNGSSFIQFGTYTWAPSVTNLLFARMNTGKTMQASLNGDITLTSAGTAGSPTAVIQYMGGLVLSGVYQGQAWGTVNEVIFYTTPLTTAQRQQVEGYLAWKWGLQGSLPGNHPYKLWPPSP